MEVFINAVVNFCVAYAPKIIGAIIVLAIGFGLSKYIVKLFMKTKLFKHIDPTVQTFLKSFISIAIKLIVVISALAILGVPMTSVITIIGTCGVAVGLALQGGLSNLAGGIIILIIRPFKVGDYIVSAGGEGTVDSIGIFYTTLVTGDNKKVLIPNGSLMNSTITAVNQLETRRVDFEFSVANDTDVDKAKSIIAATASENELVLADPAPAVVVSKNTDGAIILTLRVWAKTGDYWTVFNGLTEKMMKVFGENGIKKPIPRMKLDVNNY